MFQTHREQEKEVVEQAVYKANWHVKTRMEANVRNAWIKHRHQLLCILCGATPDENEEEYWGECYRNHSPSRDDSIVLCPPCLSSKWTLYKSDNMKIASPSFHNELAMVQMQWNVVKADEIPRYLQSELEFHPDPKSLNTVGLMAELREQQAITHVSKNTIIQWQNLLGLITPLVDTDSKLIHQPY